MKKYLILLAIICTAVILFSNCHTPKKAMSSTPAPPKVTYAAFVKSVVETNCSPCHIPSKAGNKKALDTYDNLKGSIDDVIRRIQLNPTDHDFMPFKHTKLSDSTIAIFTQWRDAGTPE
ncbi:MAG: hypothetical protein ACHQF0_04425 [Chitinophagales bacterium]